MKERAPAAPKQTFCGEPPTGMVAIGANVRALNAETVPDPEFTTWSSKPFVETATPSGETPTESVAITKCVDGCITDTVPEPEFATKTQPVWQSGVNVAVGEKLGV